MAVHRERLALILWTRMARSLSTRKALQNGVLQLINGCGDANALFTHVYAWYKRHRPDHPPHGVRCSDKKRSEWRSVTNRVHPDPVRGVYLVRTNQSRIAPRSRTTA